ncbi:MAG: outer membrane beta-barrel protein [Bacteroidota bacterium]
MKKKLLLLSALLLVCFICITSESKSQAFDKGRSYIHASYGFGNFIQSVFKIYETDYDNFSSKIMGPMFFKYEYAISEKMGIGVNFAYASASVSYQDNSWVMTNGDVYKGTIDWSTYSILARFNLHMGDHEVIDPYWGVGMGYRIANWEYADNDPSYVSSVSIGNFFPLGFETTFGCRFMFAKTFGLFGEVGIAKAIFQAGLVGSF